MQPSLGYVEDWLSTRTHVHKDMHIEMKWIRNKRCVSANGWSWCCKACYHPDAERKQRGRWVEKEHWLTRQNSKRLSTSPIPSLVSEEHGSCCGDADSRHSWFPLSSWRDPAGLFVRRYPWWYLGVCGSCSHISSGSMTSNNFSP